MTTTNDHAETTEAFPLCWPAGWPRTPRVRITAAQFGKTQQQYRQDGSPGYKAKRKITIGEAVERVMYELRAIEAGRPVVSSNVRARLDGLPYSKSAEPLDSGVAVYWTTSKGERRCMAVDRYDRVADNLAAIAATLEAFRAVARHGGGQVIDRAFTGFKAIPNLDTPKPWRKVFGFGEDDEIDADFIRIRFFELAKERHPDKGGTNQAMAELNRARDEGLAEVAAEKTP